MKDNRPRELVEAISNIVAKKQTAFFAHYLMNKMRVEYDPTTKSASTDDTTIRVGDWFLKLPIRQRVFVIAHEILHGILAHMPRAHAYKARGFGMDMQPFSWPRANHAMDYVVNAILISAQIGDMPPGGLFRSTADADRTWDEVYLQIDEPESDPDSGDGRGDGGFDEHMAPGKDAPSEEEQRQAVAQARNMAEQAGTMPAALKRLIGELIAPKLPWRVLLRDFAVAQTGKDEATWARINRRKLVLPPGIPFPGRDSHQMNCLVVAPDTSGSISQAALEAFLGEISGIIADLQPRETWLIWWDTEAKAVLVDEPEDLIRLDPYGGGGTNWDCVPRKIAELGIEPDAVVTFTDGYVSTSYVDCPWPHLTVTVGQDMPFGRNIHLTPGE